jgi:hypothetical protein
MMTQTINNLAFLPPPPFYKVFLINFEIYDESGKTPPYAVETILL